jgi:hypothetical protein
MEGLLVLKAALPWRDLPKRHHPHTMDEISYNHRTLAGILLHLVNTLAGYSLQCCGSMKLSSEPIRMPQVEKGGPDHTVGCSCGCMTNVVSVVTERALISIQNTLTFG